MSDEDSGDVSMFSRPAIHDSEVSILNELLFGGWNSENEVDELYDVFDEDDLVKMLEILESPENWIDDLMRSKVFKDAVLNEIIRHTKALKYVLEKYYNQNESE